MEQFIADWLRVSNNFDTEKYLEMYHKNSVLDDPSVGRRFIGHQGIKDYFQSYFIGYQTHTRLINLDVGKANKHTLRWNLPGIFPREQLSVLSTFLLKTVK